MVTYCTSLNYIYFISLFQMINEEWLSSSFKLCDLVTASECGHSDVSTVYYLVSYKYIKSLQ